MNALLASHRIPVNAIRVDDFDAFYVERKAALLRLIESAMGKSPLGIGYDDAMVRMKTRSQADSVGVP